MAGKRTRKKQRKGPVVIRGLDNETVLNVLEALGQNLGIDIRHENGDFKSAGCRVEDKNLILLKKMAPLSKKIKVLLRELSVFDTSAYDLNPAIQRRLDNEKKAIEENKHAESRA